MIINITEAQSIINSGMILAVPTDTVYGIAAKFSDTSAIEKLYTIKKRPNNKKITIQLSSFFDLISYIDNDFSNLNICQHIANMFWPGPITIVINIKKNSLYKKSTYELETCAFRISKNSTLLELIRKTGPLAITSSNVSGKIFHLFKEDVEKEFGHSFPILDGELPKYCGESSVVYVSKEKIKVLRHGIISCDCLFDIFNNKFNVEYCDYCLAKNDYKTNFDRKNVIGFGDKNYPNANSVIVIGKTSDDVNSVIINLISVLRKIESGEIKDYCFDFNMPNGKEWIYLRYLMKRYGLLFD